ncbi:MAG: 4Fe-4S binding protein [Candidatus Omnitrophica bacterium]|nr:4Fe-4S binding protein [Candidatus Omnitrophota bacterium]
MITRKIVKIDEEKCDGCGLCIPQCQEGAIQIVDGKARLVSDKYCDGLGACLGHCPQDAIIIEDRPADEFEGPCPSNGCPSAKILSTPRPSELGHWPVQLSLVPPDAPFLQRTDLLITADCVPLAYADYHKDFLKDKSVVICCPKLDDISYYTEKLTSMFKLSDIKSITVLHMEVPCCSGIVITAQKALAASGKDIPFEEITITIQGQRLE